MAASHNTCIICDTNNRLKLHAISSIGFKTIVESCVQKGFTTLRLKLMEMHTSNVPIFVHNECRKRLNYIPKQTQEPVPNEVIPPKRMRYRSDPFVWKNNCFLCGKPADIIRHRERGGIHEVETIPIRETFISQALHRKDDWGNEVLTRLQGCLDLVAVEAIYHNKCATRFKSNKATSKDLSKGRPVAVLKMESFERFCEWIETSCDSEIYTIQELHQKMCEEIGGEVYSLKGFREKLKQRFGDSVCFGESTGSRGELVCFKNISDFLIKSINDNYTKENIIAAASRIIKEDIRNMEVSSEFYPSSAEVKAEEEGNAWVPESLRQFMKNLIPSDSRKRLSINQCIVQASRPRSVIAPLPFGLGVSVEKSFGSKSLINLLSRLGFSISADEIHRYKHSAIVTTIDLLQESKENSPNSFIQYVGDNVDHNTATLTGKGTFHGMGIISVSKESNKFIQNSKIRRIKGKLQSLCVSSMCNIPIYPYNASLKISQEASLVLKPLSSSNFTRPVSFSCDLLWHCGLFFSSSELPRPNWSGFMQVSTHYCTEIHTKSNVQFLPIIDLNPNDMSCVYSTLKFVSDQSLKQGASTPCITFDQPLWLKAMKIIKWEDLPIVCRLGGFHMLMSFLGSVGKIMDGSGLEKVWEEVYAPNSIPHMLAGKATARALRGHFLVQSAIMSLLLETVCDRWNLKVDFLKPFYEKALNKHLTHNDIEEMIASQCFTELSEKLESTKQELNKKSRTSKLWLSYLSYIETLKLFIFAERTSNWQLHLHAVSKMLNLFAASGHSNYARSARLYLQEMEQLPHKFPIVYENFMKGEHTVQITDNNWTAIWTDLCIEMTLMRSIKSRGGLTHGRGLNETVRHLWAMSLSSCASVHNAIMDFSGCNVQQSNQHADLGASKKNWILMIARSSVHG